MDKTMVETIMDILRKYVESEEAVKNSAKEIYDTIYDLPEDKVIIASDKLRKRKVEGGYMYNFQTDGEWDVEWHFTG